MRNTISAVFVMISASLANAQNDPNFTAASCVAAVLARTDPAVIQMAAAYYYDAMFDGASHAFHNQALIRERFDETCRANPHFTVERALREVLEPFREFSTEN